MTVLHALNDTIEKCHPYSIPMGRLSRWYSVLIMANHPHHDCTARITRYHETNTTPITIYYTITPLHPYPDLNSAKPDWRVLDIMKHASTTWGSNSRTSLRPYHHTALIPQLHSTHIMTSEIHIITYLQSLFDIMKKPPQIKTALHS